MNKEPEFKELDEKELVDYIFKGLLSKGIVVKEDDIRIVLDLEMDYMIANGFAVSIDDMEEE